MKIQTTISLLFFVLVYLFLSACDTASLERDARDTPIGSVVSGETKDSDEYIKKVKQRNQSSTKSAWQPESPDRM